MQDNNDFYNGYNPEINYKPDNGKSANGGFAKGIAVGVVFSTFAFFCIILLGYFMKNSEAHSGNNIFGDGFFNDSDVISDDVMEKIELIQTYINQYSFYEQDKEVLIDNIYSALLGSIEDKYSAYYNEESFTAQMESTSGTYCGIGCVVTQNIENGQVEVVQPYKNAPAYEAGIAIGDIILKADDVELTGMDLSEAVSYIKGEEGSKVKITYFHDGEEKTVEVERRSIEIPTVEYEMLEDNVGYIHITSFDEVTSSQFSKAVEGLINDGAKGLVFDVRSNPGGMYDVVVEMLDKLLPEGTIVYTEDKYGNRETETSDAASIDLPMTVIINGNSASASEIFAGALKDYDKAEIIGTKSFGKGIVQSVVPLGDNTAIKFTIASYFTPKGVCIHGIGIEPNQVIELPTDKEAYDENGYLKDEYDTQLKGAVNYIKSKIVK